MEEKFMKKSFTSLFAIALLAASFSSCKPANNVPVEQVIDSVFEKLLASTIAVKGQTKQATLHGNETSDPFAIKGDYATAVIGDGYCFLRRDFYKYKGEFSTYRYDRGENGELVIYQLNPLTNEVDTIEMTNASTGKTANYDEFFGNPFLEESKDCFELKDSNTLVTKADEYVWINYNCMLDTLFFTESVKSPLMNIEIKFDGNYNPTKLLVEFGETTTSGNNSTTTKTIFEGEFLDPSTVEVEPIPTPRPAQAGQEKLQAMFDSLKACDYTVEQRVTHGNGEGDYTIKTYITPGMYFYEFFGEWNERTSKGILGRGEVETPSGIVPFTKTATGYEYTNLPQTIRTVEDRFGPYWSYSARSFDVNPDGTYTLGDGKGFNELLWLNLLTDGTISGPVSPANIRITVDEVNNTLTYVYGSEGGTLVTGIVNHIGSTVVPVDLTNAEAFVAPTTWEEWYHTNESWHDTMFETIKVMTNNNPDIIPFIYTPYDYDRSMNTSGKITQIEPYIIETIERVQYFKTVYEFDTIDELRAARDNVVAQLEAGPFTFDETDNLYKLHNETLNLTIEIKTVQNYVTFFGDQVFNFGLVVDVRNLDYQSGNSDTTSIIV